MLDRLRTGVRADGGQGLGARLPVERAGANLDQLACGERPFDLFEHARREAVVPNEHQGMQAMRASLELLAPGGSEFGHAGSIRAAPYAGRAR